MHKINYYLPGALLILCGVLIAAFPEILIALIASVIIVAGIAVLYLGHRIKESNEAYRGISEDGWTNGDKSQYRYQNPLVRFWGRRF